MDCSVAESRRGEWSEAGREGLQSPPYDGIRVGAEDGEVSGLGSRKSSPLDHGQSKKAIVPRGEEGVQCPRERYTPLVCPRNREERRNRLGSVATSSSRTVVDRSRYEVARGSRSNARRSLRSSRLHCESIALHLLTMRYE